MSLLVPWVEALFFRAFLTSLVGESLQGSHLVIQWGVPAFLWACYHMHYKGEFALRLILGFALQALAPAPLAAGCGVGAAVIAHALRNLVGGIDAAITLRWHRWSI
ncbi:hypothetical protein T484DRAFT_1785035 [Baffinella frigidus]|nr:hypothetical protein T484DRAFT_1785035 [Cryptophyta sp. CCMP2293]